MNEDRNEVHGGLHRRQLGEPLGLGLGSRLIGNVMATPGRMKPDNYWHSG